MTRAQQVGFLRSLGVLPPEQAEQPDGEPAAPSFDGGVRESDNWTDPMRDHDELVFDVAQRADGASGRGIDDSRRAVVSAGLTGPDGA